MTVAGGESERERRELLQSIAQELLDLLDDADGADWREGALALTRQLDAATAAWRHEIRPPLKAWGRKRELKFLLDGGYTSPSWVAIKLRAGVDFDEVFDTRYSMTHLGKPGAIPQNEAGPSIGSGWRLVPATYLRRLEPKWLTGVRSLPPAT